MRQGTMQTIHAARGIVLVPDIAGATVFFHRSALSPPERFAPLTVGMRVEVEPASGPTGLRTAKITVTPRKTLPLRSLEELAAYVHRYAAS